MRASAKRRPARTAAAGVAVTVAFLLSAVARADDPGAHRSEVERLRTENATLAAKAHEVLLELYALESRLGRAERRVAALERRAAEIERREASARSQLAVARRDLTEAERRLAARLRALYIEGGVDPLAVLLGAESLDAAVTALDGLDRSARLDQEVVAQLIRARANLRKALDRLAARRSEVRQHLSEAEAARVSLVQARAGRAAYLAELEDRRAFKREEIGSLTQQAAEIETRAQEIPVPSGGAGTTPAPVAAAAQSGATLTVLSTGYCLKGTTSTGVPVGWGVVAVDPALIPLGTRMTVPGYGDGVAADTGSGVRGAMLDLWFPTCAQALGWGTRAVTITLD